MGAVHYQWHRATGVSAACMMLRNPRPEQVTPLKKDVTCRSCRGTLRYQETRDPDRDATDPRIQRETGRTRHGHISFDVPFISPIVPGLWQGGCLEGLVLPRFIDHLVALTVEERYDVRHQLASSLTIPMRDDLDQDLTGTDSAARTVNELRTTGTVLVHCSSGLNRSGLAVARALMLGPEHMTADQAITLIRGKRSQAAICNPVFEAWLRDHDGMTRREEATQLILRHGDGTAAGLIAGIREIAAGLVLEHDPDIAHSTDTYEKAVTDETRSLLHQACLALKDLRPDIVRKIQRAWEETQPDWRTGGPAWARPSVTEWHASRARQAEQELDEWTANFTGQGRRG